jgi:hypothetical protein
MTLLHDALSQVILGTCSCVSVLLFGSHPDAYFVCDSEFLQNFRKYHCQIKSRVGLHGNRLLVSDPSEI